MIRRCLLAAACLALSACEFHRKGGDCVGLVDDQFSKPNYEYSARNVVVGLIFSESLLIPGYVVAFDLECPKEAR